MSRAYDSAKITVLLEHGHTFGFVVQDWDLEDEPLSDEAAADMAHGLVMRDRVVLWGALNADVERARSVAMRIDPKRVVGIVIEPMGHGL